MTRSVLNEILAGPPPPGHRLSVARMDGIESVDLRDLYLRAEQLAVRLREQGVTPGDRIGVLASNCLQWVLLDLAALRLKAVIAGLEPGKFAIDGDLLERYQLRLLFTDHPTDVPGARPITDVDDLAPPDPGAVDDGPMDAAVALSPVRYAPEEITTLKFTSGSTGVPKALGARAGSIDSSLHAVQEIFRHGPDDDVFVFLPLSLLQQRYWIYSALRFGHNVTVSTYEAAFVTLRRARPTVVMGVPAFYETARRHIESRANRSAAVPDAARIEARRLFGDRIRYLWTGSAPASRTTLDFFTEIGLPIYEGYGLNETCIVSKNHPGAERAGSVGQVLPGKQILFDADGVISVRSEQPVALGYEYAAPGDSERVFGADGVVRTGDLGYLDDDGFLFVTGRADDVIVLDNGRKVIVRPIEEQMKTSSAITECVVFCPAQTHLVAVVSPSSIPADEPAIAAHLARTNALLGPDEQIRKVVVAQPPFSRDNGLLTSQFKPRRGHILEAYSTEITTSQGGIHVH